MDGMRRERNVHGLPNTVVKRSPYVLYNRSNVPFFVDWPGNNNGRQEVALYRLLALIIHHAKYSTVQYFTSLPINETYFCSSCTT